MSNESSSNAALKATLFSISVLGLLLTAWLLKFMRRKPKSQPNAVSGEIDMPKPLTPSTGTPPPSISVPSQAIPPVVLKPATTWTPTTKYIVSVFLFLSFVGVIVLSQNVLSTLLLAFLLSFILAPIIKFFQTRLKMRRGSAILLTYILLIVVIILVPIIFLPAIVNGVQSLMQFISVELPTIADNLVNWADTTAQEMSSNPILNATLVPALEAISSGISGLASLSQNPSNVPTIQLDTTMQTIGNRLGQVLGVLTSVLGPLVSMLTTVGFTLLISLHMSLASDKLHDNYLNVVPVAYRPEVQRLVERLLLVWNAFLRGQLSLMVVVGTLVYLGNLVLGTPQALFLGILAGLLEAIPTLGPILATIPAIILALLLGSTHLPLEPWAFTLIVLAFYLVVQMLENQAIVPRIMGDAVDLPPLVVIVGVMIGGSVAGILGIFLAAPMIASTKVIVNYLYDKIQEKPPLPPPPEAEPTLMDSVRGWLAKIPRPKANSKEEQA